MNKRKSIIKFSLIIAATVILTVFAFLPIKGVNSYLAAPGAIKANSTDSTVSGGFYAIYDLKKDAENASRSTFGNQVEARRLQLYYELAETYQSGEISGLDVRKLSNKSLIIEVKSMTSTQGSVSLTDITALVEARHTLSFRVDDSEVLKGRNIEKVYMQTNSTAQTREMVLVLDEEGETYFSSGPTGVKIVDASDDSEIYSIPDGSAAGNKIITTLSSTSNDDYIAYYRILALSRPLVLELREAGINNTDSGTKIANLIYIGGACALVLIMLFFGLRYRLTGLMGIAGLLGYVSVFLFLLGLLPFINLSAAGLSAIIFTLILAAGSSVLVFERIKDEFRLGKSVQASVATGYRRSFWSMFDVHLVSLIAGLILWILGEGVIGGIGAVLFIGAAVSMFTSLVMTRYLVKLLINIGGDEMSPALLSLKRPEGFKESDAIPDEPEPEPEPESIAFRPDDMPDEEEGDDNV